MASGALMGLPCELPPLLLSFMPPREDLVRSPLQIVQPRSKAPAAGYALRIPRAVRRAPPLRSSPQSKCPCTCPYPPPTLNSLRDGTEREVGNLFALVRRCRPGNLHLPQSKNHRGQSPKSLRLRRGPKGRLFHVLPGPA